VSHAHTRALRGQPGAELEDRAVRLQTRFLEHTRNCGYCTMKPAPGAGCGQGEALLEARDELLGMVAEIEHLDLGTSVIYHGSLNDRHGGYIFDGPCLCEDDDCIELAAQGFQRYRLLRPDSGASLEHVHRRSFIPSPI
jgi:hypothetical protein